MNCDNVNCQTQMARPMVSVYATSPDGNGVFGHYCGPLCCIQDLQNFAQQTGQTTVMAQPQPMPQQIAPAPAYAPAPVAPTPVVQPMQTNPNPPVQFEWGTVVAQPDVGPAIMPQPGPDMTVPAQAPGVQINAAPQPNVAAGVWTAVTHNPLAQAEEMVNAFVEEFAKYGFTSERHPMEIDIGGQVVPGAIYSLTHPKMTIVIRYNTETVLMDLGGPNNVTINLGDVQDHNEAVQYAATELMNMFKIQKVVVDTPLPAQEVTGLTEDDILAHMQDVAQNILAETVVDPDAAPAEADVELDGAIYGIALGAEGNDVMEIPVTTVAADNMTFAGGTEQN